MAAYDSPGHRDPLPGVTDFQSHDSGLTAQGSSGISASTTSGGVIGTPIVSTPFASSQVAENMPRLPVAAGDSSGWSDDTPAHTSAIMGNASAAAFIDTNAGEGTVVAPPRPWTSED